MPSQRVVVGLDLHLRGAAQFVPGRVRVAGQHLVARRQAEVQLHDEAGVDDRLVLLVHRVGERVQIGLLGRVDPIGVDVVARRRRRGHERFVELQAVERRLEVGEVALHEIGALVA